MPKVDFEVQDNEWPEIEIKTLRGAIERIERILVFDDEPTEAARAAISECRAVLNL